MNSFDFVEPRSLEEALEWLAAADPSVRPASGCTALMLMMKAGVLQPQRLVGLQHIEPSFARIEAGSDEIRIGAMCTLADIESSEIVQRALPAVSRTMRRLANVRVRNVAMLGGHLAHADPHMDLPPLLSALGATLTIASRGAQRTIGIEALIRGYYETALEDGELICEVRIPTRLARTCVYRKVTARSADDWPTLGVAVALDIAEGTVHEASIVVSAAFDRPTRLAAVEAVLRGMPIDERTIASAAEVAAEEAQPIADAHGSAAYKRALVRVHVGRALREATATPLGELRA